MTVVQYSNGMDIRTVSMHIDDWHRLLDVAQLTTSEQDQRILEIFRYALANGDSVSHPDQTSSE